MQNTLWKLFENTGNIQAYLYYKSIEGAVASKVKINIESSKKQVLLR